MLVIEIQAAVSKLNAATPATSKKAATKKPAPVAKAIAAPKAQFDPDEHLRFEAERIVTAFGMAAQGVTVEAIIAGVHKYEGAVQ